MAINSTSIANTPQAGDDSYAYLEDVLSQGSVFMDVMANDLGGKAKTLYSLDDGDGALKDLLTRDPNLSTPWERTADGNEIRINCGRIEFRIGPDFDIDSLAQGEGYTDSFVYAIQMGNGTLSYATVTINITGQNDLATISGDDEGSVVEDGSTLVAGGTLTVNDVDNGENAFKPVESLKGAYGSFTFDSSTGAWTYTLDNGTDGQPGEVQALRDGEVVWEMLHVESLDGSAVHEIKVKITGKNDTATITGQATGSVAEDGDPQASGSLAVSDVDAGENVFQSPAEADLQGDYGVFGFADGAWTYDLDNDAVQSLGEGVTRTDTLVVQSHDGTAEETITVTVTGKNDLATITGGVTADVAEDGTLGASGALLVEDVDAGEDVFKTLEPAELQGDYGLFTFTGGDWTYTLDNAVAQVLGKDEIQSDTLTVESADGTASRTITVTITGKNDVATFGGAETGEVFEDGVLTATGLLTVDDVDGEDEESFQAATDLQGSYGKLSIDAGGQWTYTLDNGHAALATLDNGEELEDAITVRSLDGTETVVTVTINGKTDAPPVTAITLPTQSPTPTTGTPVADNDNKNSLTGTEGNDKLQGLNGADTLNGLGGNDILEGGNGTDTLNGGTGNDYLYGDNGADDLDGGAGNDVIFGGEGADDIIGGEGSDWLYGQDHADVFHYSNANEALDVIVGFQSGIDKLSFSTGISGGSSGVVQVDTNTDGIADSTLVRIDSNGAAAGGTVTDMVVLLGVTSIAAGDIVWNA